MRRKFLSALILSTFILSAQAQDTWLGSGKVELNEDYMVSDNNRFPEQTGDLIIEGNGYGVDGGGNQGYRSDIRLPDSTNNPTKDGVSITIDSVGSFTVNDASETGDTIHILDKEGNIVNKKIEIKNEGLHNFKWGAGDTVSSVEENTSVFYHNGDITITNSVIKDNKVEHNTDYNGRSGGAIKWNNDIEYGDDWEIESETGKNGFELKNSLVTGNGINFTAETGNPDECIISGGAFYLSGSGENNKSNTVLIDNTYFINNYIDAKRSEYAQGGALTTSGINDFKILNSYFGKNYVKGAVASGGAIYIDNVEVYGEPYVIENTSFENNYVKSDTRFNGIAQGGAIASYYYTDIKNSLFLNNTAESEHIARGGALYLKSGDEDYDETQENYGWNDFSYNIENSIFKGNNAKMIADMGSVEIKGGAIFNEHFASTTIKNSKFEDNKSLAFDTKDAQANAERSAISSVGASSEQLGTAQGGAIYNNSQGDLTIIDSVFTGNLAVGSKDGAGGAIFNEKDATLTIVAENADVLFENNKSGKNLDELYSDAITDNGGTINVNAKEGRTVKFNDSINSYNENTEGTLNINKSSDDASVYNGTILLNNDMNGYKGTVNLEGGTLAVGKNGTLFENAQAFNVNAVSHLNVANGQIGTYNFGNLHLNADLNASVDADLANGTIDKFNAKSVTSQNNSHVNIEHVNLLSDIVDGQDVTDIQLTDDTSLRDVITLSDGAKEALTPIWRYNVRYDSEQGSMRFTRGDKADSPSGGFKPESNPTSYKAFNPAVLSSVVSAQAGAVATMNNGFLYAMQNSENYMNFSKKQRLAYKLQNRYASDLSSSYSPFSPLYTKQSLNGAWFKPYSTFENIPLDNGPKVQNISYGAYMGYDSEIMEIEHGWERSWTGYASYNGASQKFSGVDSTLNGGTIGGTLSLYKGNFFNALTFSTGSLIGDSSNMYGKEDYTMMLAGVANRFGYNFETPEGRFIFQPSLLLGYTFVKTFDYSNSAGIRINSKPLSVMQISPNAKFILNTESGWQPYFGVGMVWNIINNTEVTANDVILPQMSIKPYVQYGIGIQRVVNSDFMMFGQAMMQNGGRNGISLSAGLRWTIGKIKHKSPSYEINVQ